jgi:diguanylate cyclase (GGDEF)-like protein
MAPIETPKFSMPSVDLKPKNRPEIDHRNAVLSLRWLLVILASYLTLFSYIGTELFPVVSVVALLFALSNVALMLTPRRWFIDDRLEIAVTVLDVIFVAITLYLLRVPDNYLFVAFTLIFVLAALWRDLRLVLFSVLVVSVLFGVFSYFRLLGFQFDVNIEQFLTAALFFVVSIFYVFLSGRLMQDGRVSNAILEEGRLAEVMVEMTRALSSSLNSDEVLYSIVSRLREVLHAEECSIFRIDPKTGAARVMMKASNFEERNIEVDLNQYPELKQAHSSRRLLFIPDARPVGIIAIPMVVNDSVLGLIDVRSGKLGRSMTKANERFLEVLASTAANALRNAQLFEEVQQRARTDFLTGLPNHGFFQATLSAELGRAKRHQRTLSLLMIDLDFLKAVNDQFGHPSGDTLIRTVAETVRGSLRENDFPARYGGEEFTIILPETPLIGAIQVAERIRERIAAEEHIGIGHITASIGVSNYPLNATNKEDLIRIADQAMYLAKKNGRDRVAYFNYQTARR